jgi:hypothetical protein
VQIATPHSDLQVRESWLFAEVQPELACALLSMRMQRYEFFLICRSLFAIIL